MKKKWMPHIVTAGNFVVFIVLGLACAVMPSDTSEERDRQLLEEEAEEEAAVVDEFIKNNSYVNLRVVTFQGSR